MFTATFYSSHWQSVHGFASFCETCQFWIIQSLISATASHLANTCAHPHRTRGLQGYYNNTSVGLFGEAGILLPSRQNLSDAFPHAFSPCKRGIQCTPPVHLQTACSVYFKGALGLECHKQKKKQFNFPSQEHWTSTSMVPVPCIIHCRWCAS